MTKILVIDDREELLEEVVFQLQQRGYTTLTANSGREALELLETPDNLPDVIVSDIAMPDIDGYQLLEEVQQVEEMSEIPFIFITGQYSSLEDIRVGKQLGADDYLLKPFQVEDLIAAIENKLRKVRQWQERTRLQVEYVREELLSLVTHQINSPRSSIHSDYQILLEDLEALPDEFSRKALYALQQETQRINRFTNQIIILIRADNGQLQAEFQQEKQAYHVSMLVEAACYMIENELRDYALNIQVNLSSQPMLINGVYNVLLLIFAEVIRNAVLFSPNLTAEIRAAQDGKVAVIQVLDNGSGIAPEHLPHIWERFARFKILPTPQQGVGLGLPLVRDCVQVHGGQISVDSQPSVGTIVTLKFPLAI